MPPATTRTTAAPAARAPATDSLQLVPLAVWPCAQTSAQYQRLGRYLPGSSAHPGKMLPQLARRLVAEYCPLGGLVADPMCGIGPTLVEAAALGRRAVGVELEPRWAALARANLTRALPAEQAAPGRPPHPVELDLVFRTERGTPVNPNHASRAFARLAASVGLAAHPHLLRHALASAMAANKEPASIIAAQLRHADGGALAQRVYIHQLPQTAPRLAGMIEGVFGPAGRDTRAVSAGCRAEGNRRETRPRGRA